MNTETKYPIEVLDDQGRETYFESTDGVWYKQEFDEHGNICSYSDSLDYWWKAEYNDDNIEIYYENEKGVVTDLREK